MCAAVAAIVVVAASWVAVAASATTVLHPGQYTLTTATLQNPGFRVGGYLACKNANTHRLVAGGGFWHAPGEGPAPINADEHAEGSSTVTSDGKGWYADEKGAGPRAGDDGEVFTMVALCLPKAQVGTYTVRTVTYDVSAGAAAGNYVSCPASQRIVTGGAYWHAAGEAPDPNNDPGYISSSTPTTDGKGWYADGLAFTNGQLTITAFCLPLRRIGAYTLKTATLDAVEQGESQNYYVGNYLSCPKNKRIVAGGAFWHLPGKGPDLNNAREHSLSSSTPTTDGKGWYADGDTATEGEELTLVAQCLPA